MDSTSGKLILVPTPLGNLQDLTFRALEVLKSVDCIACEDTRHSLKLLNHYGIKKPLLSLHEHNEHRRATELVEKIRNGLQVALISDAGTPLISDPGFPLVEKVLEAGLDLEALPGPCAALTALVASGLPTDRFYFVGFLPHKSAARLRILEELKAIRGTLIFYESPHRIQKLLNEAFVVFGGRRAALFREMTKRFEEALRGPLGELGKTLQPKTWKGEFVFLVSGAEPLRKQALKRQKVFPKPPLHSEEE